MELYLATSVIGLAAICAHCLLGKGNHRDICVATSVKSLDKKATTVVHMTHQAIR
jgi:hypothetical protein